MINFVFANFLFPDFSVFHSLLRVSLFYSIRFSALLNNLSSLILFSVFLFLSIYLSIYLSCLLPSLPPSFYLFIYSFIHLFIYSFIHSFILFLSFSFLLKVIILVSSNSAMVPAVLLCIRYEQYMLGALLSSASIASSFYHLCDTDVFCLGGLSFTSLQVQCVVTVTVSVSVYT